MIKGFADWRRGGGGDAGNGTFLVLSQYKTAKALEKQRDKKGADQYYRETIKAFDLSGEKPKSDAAELAGEAQFWLAEQEYKRSFETYKGVGKGKMTGKDGEKNVKATLDGLAKKAKDAVAGYQAVARFESSWSLAAIVRLGDVAWYSADKLIMAAPPTDIVKLDKKYPDQGILQQYQDGIDAQVAPQKEDAKTLWEKAVTTAKAAGVSNEFSKLAQTRLNSFVASDLYPVQREDVVEKEANP